MIHKREFWKSMLSDSKTNQISSKRFIGFLGFIFLSITMMVNSFYNTNIEPSHKLIEAVEFITISSLFGSTIDKFTKN